MLLNACLTVSAGQAGSHHSKGWEPFTKAVLRAIADEASRGAKTSVKSSTIASMFSKVDGSATEKPGAAGENSSNSGEEKTGPSKGVVFLAWGQPAQKMLAEAGINDVSACRAAASSRADGHGVYAAACARNCPTRSSFARHIPRRCLPTVASSATGTLRRPTSGSRHLAATAREVGSSGVACSPPSIPTPAPNRPSPVALVTPHLHVARTPFDHSGQ